MEIIYRTFDGKEFTSEREARRHESVLSDGIVMIGRDGNKAYRTEDAFILWLKNEEANLAFFALAENQGDTGIQGLVKGEDYGLFYWDEYEGAYRWVADEVFTALVRAQSAIQEKGGKSNV